MDANIQQPAKRKAPGKPPVKPKPTVRGAMALGAACRHRKGEGGGNARA
jgi:hypothetical protein